MSTSRSPSLITLPRVTLRVNGAVLSADATRALGNVRVHQQLSLPTLCELTFLDPPGPLPTGDVLQPGLSLRVLAGDQPLPLFEGEITAVTYGYGPAQQRELRVRGYDLLHRLRKRRAPRVHVQTTVSDLAADLVANLGLKVQTAEPGPLHPRIIQHRRSDLQLLRDVAGEAGLYPVVRGDTLHLFTLTGDGEILSLRWGETLLEARIDLNSETAYPAALVAGWHPLRVEAHEAEARRGRVAVSSETARAAELARAQMHRVGALLTSDREAEAAARADIDRYRAYEAILWGAAEGDSRLRVGVGVALKGVAEAASGPHVLTAVTHAIDHEHGFLTEFSTQPPAPPPRPASQPNATLGLVTRVDDPQDLGRVRAALPAYEDAETDWMHVVMTAAGSDKGFIALPDVGDRVLALFPQGDPAQGVVLGGLYGMDGPPDSGVEDARVRRYTLLTADGQRIQLDDQTHTLRLQDRQGNRVELKPGRLLLHAAGDLTLEAPGHQVTIRGKSIDFQRG